MPVEICTVSGYEEVGKNMTAVRVDDEVIILDMGLDLDNYIRYTENEDLIEISKHALIKAGAIPDDNIIADWKDKVKAIIPTHGHLDHIGALVFMCNSYKAPIICTPYTGAIISTISKDEDIKIKTPIKILNANSPYKISKNITVELIQVTHSIPQTAIVCIYTKYGIILYSNDFKFDNHPIIGKRPAYKKLEEIGKKNVLLLISESLRAAELGKTPSEIIARDMLRDVLQSCNRKKGIIVTTFSSHLARLKSIIEFGKAMKRRVVFLGRSLAKYTDAGERIGIVKFSDSVEIVKYAKEIKKKLKEIDKEGREKYLLVVTGHQGEQKSTLAKIVNNEIPFKFNTDDSIIFSCTVIPSPINVMNRKDVEAKLKKCGVRIFRDIHVSGHASKEDLRELISMTKPKHVIPAHGDHNIAMGLVELCKELGYKQGQTIHLMRNGERLEIQ